jgi:hypothetical protein
MTFSRPSLHVLSSPNDKSPQQSLPYTADFTKRPLHYHSLANIEESDVTGRVNLPRRARSTSMIQESTLDSLIVESPESLSKTPDSPLKGPVTKLFSNDLKPSFTNTSPDDCFGASLDSFDLADLELISEKLFKLYM